MQQTSLDSFTRYTQRGTASDPGEQTRGADDPERRVSRKPLHDRRRGTDRHPPVEGHDGRRTQNPDEGGGYTRLCYAPREAGIRLLSAARVRMKDDRKRVVLPEDERANASRRARSDPAPRCE
jgi:hypothetical protein